MSMMKSNLYSIMGMALAMGGMDGGMFNGWDDKRGKLPDFEKLSDEHWQKIIKQAHENREEEKREHAKRNGLKAYKYSIEDFPPFYEYALNDKNGYRKVENALVKHMRNFGIQGMERPEYTCSSGVNIITVNRAYEEGRQEFSKTNKAFKHENKTAL